MTVRELALLSGLSTQRIYVIKHELGRMPTLEELKNRKNGRPRKEKGDK